MKFAAFFYFLTLFDKFNFLSDSLRRFAFTSLPELDSYYQEGSDYELSLTDVNEFEGFIKFNNSEISFECHSTCLIISIDCSFQISNSNLSFKNVLFNISSSNANEISYMFLGSANSSITLQVHK